MRLSSELEMECVVGVFEGYGDNRIMMTRNNRFLSGKHEEIKMQNALFFGLTPYW